MRRFTQGLFLAGALATMGCDQTLVSPAAALVTGQHGIQAIATDGSFVYWSTAEGAVLRISIDGGEPETVVPAQPGFVPSDNALVTLKVDAHNVYWTTAVSVVSAPKEGGAPIVLAGDAMTPLSDLTGLTVDDASEFVYFTHGRNPGSGFVRKAPKIPGETVTLASAEDAPRSPIVRGATLYWVATVAGEDAARVIEVDGGEPATVQGSSSGSGYAGFSADDSNVYWAETGGAVSWVSIAGGTANVIQSGEFAVPQLLGDVTRVYWSSLTGDIGAAPVRPYVAPELVASGPAGLVSLAGDSINLYWANQTDGSVVMMPKLAIPGGP